MMGGVIFVVFFVIALRRGRRDGVALPRTAAWVGKGFLFMMWLAALGPAGLPGFLALAPPMLLFLMPRLVLRLLVVPLGLPRLAYWTARIASPPELINDSGLGTCYGALALARRRSASAQSAAWLADSIERARFPRGAGVVAAGLLAAQRGDRVLARCLFGFADALHGRLVHPGVRALARDWLVAEAAQQGDWRRVTRLGRRGWRSLRWSYCMARLGERLSGPPARQRGIVLWACWILAPRRRATLPLLRQALRAPQRPAAEPRAASDLPDALGILAGRLDRRFAQDSRALADALGAIEALLDGPGTKDLVHRRLAVLGAPPETGAVLSGMRTRLTSLLAPFVEEAPQLGGADTGSFMLDQASEEVRARWFKDVDAQCKDYVRRAEAETALGMMAEAEIWAVLRDKAERLLELAPGSEQILFQAMYLPVNNFAVFQQNTCKRRMLAFDMYSWIRGHARHDAAASQLLDKNIKSCQP